MATVPSRIGVGQEEGQALERLEGRAVAARSGSSPTQEVAVPGRVVEVAVADRTGAEGQVRQPQVEGTQRKLELPAVEWLGQLIEGGRAVAGHALGIAGHEPSNAERAPRGPRPTSLEAPAGRRRRSPGLEALRRERRAAQRPVLPITEQVVGLDEGMQLAGAFVDDGALLLRR